MPSSGKSNRIALVVALVASSAVAFTFPSSQLQIASFVSRSKIDLNENLIYPAVLYSKNTQYDEFLNDNDESKNKENIMKTTRFNRQNLKKWRRISTVSLAFFTSTFSLNNIQNQKFWNFRPPVSSAMGPNLLAPRLPENRPKTGKDLENEIANKAMQKKMTQDNAEYEKERARIYREEGSEAHQKFMTEYRKKKTAKFLQKRKDRDALIKRLLLEQGLDPWTNMKGRAILFEFDYGVDLYQESGTMQYHYLSLRKSNPAKFIAREKKEIELTLQTVEEFKEEGLTPDEIVTKFREAGTRVLTDKEMFDREFAIMKEQKREKEAKREAERRLQQEAKLAKKNPELYKKQQELKMMQEKESEKRRSETKVEEAVEAADEAELKAKIISEKAKKMKQKAKEEKKALKERKKLEKQEAKEKAKAMKENKEMEKAALAAAAVAASASKAAAELSAAAGDATGAIIGDAVEAAKEIVEESSTNISDEIDEVDESPTEESVPKPSASLPQSSAAIKKSKILSIVPAVAVCGAVGGGGFAFKLMKEKTASDEEERQRQFNLLMGIDDESTNSASSKPSFPILDDDPVTVPDDTPSPSPPAVTPPATSSTTTIPRKKKGIGAIFSKKSASARETDISNLLSSDAIAPNFALTLSKILTFGAPGRFPDIVNLPDPTGFSLPETLVLEDVKAAITKSQEDEGLTGVLAVELFASVVNCMIIDIIDMASTTLTLKGEEKEKEKKTVDALNVVLDFMDHAASLFDAIADGVTITPVTYGGSLSKAKLEKMFGIYAGSLMSSFMSEESSSTQERVDILQQVFNIKDKKAEGIAQKIMMKNLMSAMKDGDGGGMEGLAEMMSGLEGMEGGIPGFEDPNAELSPEDIKQSVSMMKALVESGQISKDEIALVKEQFQEAYGASIEDLIAEADSGNMGDELGEDGRELLDLFKKVLDEDI